MRYLFAVLVLVALSGCASQPQTSASKEKGVVQSLTDNGCRIIAFRTSTGPGGRTEINVACDKQ